MSSDTADRAGQTKFGNLDAWSEKLVRSQEVLIFFKELREAGVGTGTIEGRMRKMVLECGLCGYYRMVVRESKGD